MEKWITFLKEAGIEAEGISFLQRALGGALYVSGEFFAGLVVTLAMTSTSMPFTDISKRYDAWCAENALAPAHRLSKKRLFRKLMTSGLLCRRDMAGRHIFYGFSLPQVQA